MIFSALGRYVELNCKDDEATFKSSGFEAVSTIKAPPAALSEKIRSDAAIRGGVQSLKIKKDHLPILCPEGMNQLHESIQRQLLVQMFSDVFIGSSLKHIHVI